MLSLQEDLKIKIAFVGSKGTGKSNIRARLCRGTFTEYSNSTVGIQLSNRNFKGPFEEKVEILNIICWDIEPDANDALMVSFLRNALGVVYVYDCTKKQTFEELQYWRQTVSQLHNSQNFVEMVIGNKTDLNHFREVKKYEGQNWCNKKKIPLFFETSALMNVNIENAFHQFAQQIMSSFHGSIQRPLKLVRKQVSHRGCF